MKFTLLLDRRLLVFLSFVLPLVLGEPATFLLMVNLRAKKYEYIKLISNLLEKNVFV